MFGPLPDLNYLTVLFKLSVHCSEPLLPLLPMSRSLGDVGPPARLLNLPGSTRSLSTCASTLSLPRLLQLYHQDVDENSHAIRLPAQCLMLPYSNTIICLYYQCTLIPGKNIITLNYITLLHQRGNGIPVHALHKFMQGYKNLLKLNIPSKIIPNSFLVMNRQNGPTRKAPQHGQWKGAGECSMCIMPRG
jgi:hypothetical protein